MSLRRPKSIITDYRSDAGRATLPSARQTPPLERTARPEAAAWKQPNAALDALGKRRASEAAEHDRNVATYGIDLALSAFEDMRSKKVSNPKTPEQWWIARRFSALARRLMKLNAASC